ncbi:MAG: hypothetical protein R3F61_05460 [Myxococcota bacterium]
MSFEKDSIFSDQIDSKKSRPSNKRQPPKKEAEGLDDLFGGGSSSSDKSGGQRVPVKPW